MESTINDELITTLALDHIKSFYSLVNQKSYVRHVNE